MTEQQADNGNNKKKAPANQQTATEFPIETMQQQYHNGNMDALAELLQHFQPQFHLKLAPMCDGLASRDPADFVQDAYVNLCQPRVYDRYDPSRPFLPWILTILKNDVNRRKRRGALIRWIITKPGLKTLQTKCHVAPEICDKLLPLLGKPHYNETEFKEELAIHLDDSELASYCDDLVAVACNRKRLYAVLDRVLNAERTARFTPAEATELRDESRRTAEAMARLDTFTQVVYMYRFVCGMKQEEIAARMGTSTSTISKTLSKLVPTLRRLLRQVS